MHKPAVLITLAVLGVAACGASERGEAPAPVATSKAVSEPDASAASVASTSESSAASVAQPSESRAAPVEASLATSASASDGMAYDLGRQLGEQTARSAWRSLSPEGSCEAVEKLSEVLSRASGRILDRVPADQDKLDYAEGYVHGLRAALADVAASCPSACSALCRTATSAGTAILCEAQKLLGGEVLLRRVKDFPAIACPEAPADCGQSPTGVRAGDCP